MMKNAAKTKVKKRKPVKRAILLVFLALLVTGLVIVGREAVRYYKEANVLVDHAEDLKSELKSLVTHVEKGNYEAANLSVQKIDNLSAEMRQIITDERWVTLREKTPMYGDDLDTAVKFLDVVDEASDTLIKPGVQFLREKGLPNKSTFTKISPELANTLNDYSDLIDKLAPAAEKVLNDFNALPQFEYEKLEKKVSKYRVLARDNAPEIITYLHFAKEKSDSFMRPVAKFLKKHGNDLKIEFSMDSIGPEMASKLVMFSDAIDELFPLAEQTLKDFNALPLFKIDKVEKKLTKYRKLAKDNEADILSLMSFARELTSGMVRPAAAVMKRSPISKLKTVDGDIDTKVIRDYLSLVETVRPYLSRIQEVFKTNKILKDHPKQTAKITSKLDSAMELLQKYDEYVPYIDVVLGDGSDKTYMFIAQNSAEIRACGGLPASMGVITIKDGILHIGKFLPCLKVIPYLNKGINSNFPQVEKDLFYMNWYGYKLTCATVNPHFPRAAQILARGYKKKNKKAVDGIISMTPAIVGRLIAITGPITLKNGVKLDEKYSVKYLQRDVYFQYFTKKAMTSEKLHKQADDKCSEVFAEAAKKVISNVMKDLDLKKILKLVDVIKKSSEDRVFMMWMANSKDQEIVKKLGCSGSLNYDSKNPELGVFFNIKDANRLGNYVDIKVTMGKEKKNKDGSVTYPVTVKLKNNIDSTTLKKGQYSAYLTSRHGGTMRSIIYFFAPKGGTVTSVKNNGNLRIKKTKYQKLQVAYSADVFDLKPKKTITFTFNVTTAPGVAVKPRIVKTPLLTAYRNAKPPK